MYRDVVNFKKISRMQNLFKTVTEKKLNHTVFFKRYFLAVVVVEMISCIMMM